MLPFTCKLLWQSRTYHQYFGFSFTSLVPFVQFEFISALIDSVMTSCRLVTWFNTPQKNGDLEKYQHVQQTKLGRLSELWSSMRYRQIYCDVVCYVFFRCALWLLDYLYIRKIAMCGRNRLLVCVLHDSSVAFTAVACSMKFVYICLCLPGLHNMCVSVLWGKAGENGTQFTIASYCKQAMIP